MSKRDLTGAVDFGHLERFALNDAKVIDEVLALFREQAALWAPLLDANVDGWRDAVHTIKGSARGVGAFALGEACDHAERVGAGALPSVHAALDAALFDVAAYVHEQALKSLKGDALPLTDRIDPLS
jgi:chemotaxis protein histidine kinase CheA